MTRNPTTKHQAPTTGTPGSGSSQRGRRPNEEEPEPTTAIPRRWSARRKVDIVLRHLRGESLDSLSRETRQPAARIAEWRENFLAGGEASMKARAGDPAAEAAEEERRRLQAKIGKQAMEIELLYERCHKMEDGLPPARRRSKR